MSGSSAFETTTTGSRRAVRADERRQFSRRAVLFLVVAGALLVLVGLALLTVLRPTTTTTASASVQGSAPIVLSAPGLMESRPGALTVRAVGSGRVLVGVGSEGDVTAWARGAARSTLLRLTSGGGMRAGASSGTASVPDPAGSDLWVTSATGSGGATLHWSDRPGRWLFLVAGDGSAPAPHRIVMSWRHRGAPWWAWPLVVAGLIFLVLARRERRARTGRRTGATS